MGEPSLWISSEAYLQKREKSTNGKSPLPCASTSRIPVSLRHHCPNLSYWAALRFQKPGTLYSTGVSQCDIGATMKIWAQETKSAQKTGAEGEEWSEPWCKCKSKHQYYRCSLSSVLVEWELHSRHCSQWECSGKTIHTLRKVTFLF